MSSCIFYLDESGDLGWSFDKPYRRGGSSRYLTISALEVPSDKKHLPKRIIRRLYDKYKQPSSEEMKWALMDAAKRTDFAEKAKALCELHNDIKLNVIVVDKQKVQPHIRADANKLYNYMIKLGFLQRLALYDHVTLVPDPRTIKVESGNSLHDYLQTELWFTAGVATKLSTQPADSKNCLGLQFADMVSGTVQGHFEDGETANFSQLSRLINVQKLFFY